MRLKLMSSDNEGLREWLISTEQSQEGVSSWQCGLGIDPNHTEERFPALLHDRVERNGDGTVGLSVYPRRHGGPAVMGCD